MYTLHGFFRSSASFRVRIALNLKGLEYEQVSYNLRGGEHRAASFLVRNNQGLVPALETPAGEVLNQSLAIVEFLERANPDPELIPRDCMAAAQVRALAYRIVCDIHPINNLRVLKYLESELGHSQGEVADWFRHWVTTEFDTLEFALATSPHTGRYCFGDRPTLADICLIPQVFNGQRFDLGVEGYPTIERIFTEAMGHPAFERAAPQNQPDAE